MVRLLERLVEAESPSLDPEAQRKPFTILASELAGIDYVVRHVRDTTAGDHLYARPRRRLKGAPRQLLIGHMDTVWPIGTLTEMPLHAEGDLLYGPGTADMKGGLVEIVFALRALHELGLEPPAVPVVLINTDEEVGSIGSTPTIRRLAHGAERAFVLESGEGVDGRLKIARKGIGRFTLTVHGRSAHAGADFERGVSAILELSHQVERLFALNDPAHGLTVNVGTIDGGLRPNVVAPIASAAIDVRAPTANAGRAFERRLRAFQPMLEGCTLEIAGGFRRPPMEPLARNRALLAAAKRAGYELGVTLEDAGLVGGGSDANTASLETGTLDGLGPIAEGSHAADEHLNLGRLAERTALLALLLLEPADHPLLARRRPRRVRARAPTATSVALLGTAASRTNLELAAAWRDIGLDTFLVGPDAAVAAADRGATVLGRLDVLPSVDGIEPGLLTLQQLEWQGARVLNRARALGAAHDKLVTARLLARAGVPHPRTEHVRGDALPRIEPPLVLKPRMGSWGLDVFRCDDAETLYQCLTELRERPWFARLGVLAQELVPPQGHDLRLLIAANRVVGVAGRVAAPGEWRTNISLGGQRVATVPPLEACRLGVRAAAAIGTDLVGVDLLPLDDGFTVIELNGAADFNGQYSLPSRNVFRDAAEALGLLPSESASPGTIPALGGSVRRP